MKKSIKWPSGLSNAFFSAKYSLCMQKDRIYQKKRKGVGDFVFDATVACVFDDMVARSVPFYNEIHRAILDIIGKIAKEPLVIYDLGCSTGTTITLIDKLLQKKKMRAQFFAVDNSQAMLEICQDKLKKNHVKNVEIICSDLQEVSITSANIVIVNYTMQFLPVDERIAVLKKIHHGLLTEGLLILSEKIKCDPLMNNLIEELYYEFKKKNGYSELEIAQKREALENTLMPLSVEKQMQMLKQAGFTTREMIFRFYNFACFLGLKQ